MASVVHSERQNSETAMSSRCTRCKPLLILIGVLLPGPAATAAGADVFGMGRDREIKLGREVAAYIEQTEPMSDDPVAIAKVTRLGQRLVSVSGEPDWPWEFHVIADDEINAFCLPGGFIYVYEGLLQAMPSDDALAFVLGHEMTHATERHFVSRLRKARLLSVLTLGWGDLLSIFLQPHYSREDEYKADELGLILACRAGYSADGGAEAMATLLKLSGSGRGGIRLFRDHPPTDARVQRLREHGERIRAEGIAQVYQTLTASEVRVATSPLGDLSAYELAPNASLPLAVGAVWRYQCRGSGGAHIDGSSEVLEELPGNTPGVFRVRTTLGSVSTEYLAATSTDGLLKLLDPTDPNDAWAIEWQLPGAAPPDNPYFRVAGLEQVSVPYGTLEAVRVEMLDEEGNVLQTAWFAEGVGLVKRDCPSLGITEVLESYQPSPL